MDSIPYNSKSKPNENHLETSDLISFEKIVFSVEEEGSKIIDHLDIFEHHGEVLIGISTRSSIHFVCYNDGKVFGKIAMHYDHNSNTFGIASRVYFFTHCPEIPMLYAIYEQCIYRIDLKHFSKELLCEKQIYSYYYKTSSRLGDSCIVFITHKDDLVIFNLRTRRIVTSVDPGFSLYSVSDFSTPSLYVGGSEKVMRCRIDISESGDKAQFEKEEMYEVEGNVYTVTLNTPTQVVVGTSKGVVYIFSTRGKMGLVKEKKVVPSIIPGLICSGNKVLIVSFFLDYIRIFDFETEELWNSEKIHENDVNCIIWVDNRKRKMLTAGDDGMVILWNCSTISNSHEWMAEVDRLERVEFIIQNETMNPFSKEIILENKTIRASTFMMFY